MGLGIGDYDLRRRARYLQDALQPDTNVLYRNDGKGVFDDVRFGRDWAWRRASSAGARHGGLRQRWSARSFLHHRQIFPEVNGKVSGRPYKSPNVLFRNLGEGRFEELPEPAGPAMKELHSSRGLRWAISITMAIWISSS